jgi:hypothetical protein
VKRKTERAFKDKRVAKVFAAYPANIRAKLKVLREIIFETAETIDSVGAIEETLKWSQPSYLTAETGSGSTIRIGRVKPDDDRIAMYFHCQTDLVETFREFYPTQMEYGGNRSILFDAAAKIPKKALRHCVGLALTYHTRKPTGTRTGKKRKSESPETPPIRTRRARPS